MYEDGELRSSQDQRIMPSRVTDKLAFIALSLSVSDVGLASNTQLEALKYDINKQKKTRPRCYWPYWTHIFRVRGNLGLSVFLSDSTIIPHTSRNPISTSLCRTKQTGKCKPRKCVRLCHHIPAHDIIVTSHLPSSSSQVRPQRDQGHVRQSQYPAAVLTH